MLPLSYAFAETTPRGTAGRAPKTVRACGLDDRVFPCVPLPAFLPEEEAGTLFVRDVLVSRVCLSPRLFCLFCLFRESILFVCCARVC